MQKTISFIHQIDSQSAAIRQASAVLSSLIAAMTHPDTRLSDNMILDTVIAARNILDQAKGCEA